jgi:hypothetical protein
MQVAFISKHCYNFLQVLISTAEGENLTFHVLIQNVFANRFMLLINGNCGVNLCFVK